jgi:hypothetical protein
VRVTVGVEDVDDRIFVDRQHEPVGGLGAAKLVEIGFEFFGLAP